MKISIIRRKIKTVINNPKSVLQKVLYLTSPIFSDAFYLTMLFWVRTGEKLNLSNPVTFNEKLQWLKINYRNPIQTQLVDKYEAKRLVGKMIGEQYIVECYGVWDSFDDICFDDLPEQFVLKTTHDQGGIVIVKKKSKLNISKTKNLLNAHLKCKHYYLTREWPYKNVKPRIIAEKFLSDPKVQHPNDYKFFCFDGKPKVVLIATERFTDNPKFDFFDVKFNLLDLEWSGQRSGKDIKKPQNYELMLSFAEYISLDFPHARVDFYEVDGHLFFGEITFYPTGGMSNIKPYKWNEIWGDWISLKGYSE